MVEIAIGRRSVTPPVALFTFFSVNFCSVLLRVPIFRIENANRNEHAQACHMSTGLLFGFETEPNPNRSKSWGVYFYV